MKRNSSSVWGLLLLVSGFLGLAAQPHDGPIQFVEVLVCVGGLVLIVYGAMRCDMEPRRRTGGM